MTHPADRKTDVSATDAQHFLKQHENVAAMMQRHLAFGWWALLLYLALGIVLEAMHGFKIEFLLDVSNETRRLLWRLAHAHGTLLALVNIAFALTVKTFSDPGRPSLTFAGRCLMGATILLPTGFFAGGWFVYGGDPGYGIVLVPLGAVMLLVGVLLAARFATSAKAKANPSSPPPKTLRH
jgi:hypothetical protein